MPDDTTEAWEVLADAYDAAGYRDEAAAFRAGQWTCHDHPALSAMLTYVATARQSAIEACATLAEAKAAEFRALEPLLEGAILSATVLEDHAVMVRQLGFSGEEAK